MNFEKRNIRSLFCGMLLWLLLAVGSVFAQPFQQANAGNFKTHALVIGISKYKDKGIESLKYADKDARLFAEFLRSEAGGKVPNENIRLLLNEQATKAAIDAALYEILENAGRDDQVFIYFSGHGDVEDVTLYKFGYLLAHNTPPNNYANHAVKIEDINIISNTLSVKKNAKVVLITDACRSGKLAGDVIHGRRLIGEQLRKVMSNEVRIASCGPDELSAEGESWGEGRGVFSYYLLKGLYGQAAKAGGVFVNAGDVGFYLAEKFATDKLLKAEDHKQKPLVAGNIQMPLAKKIPGTEKASAEIPTAISVVPLLPIDIFTTALKEKNIEEQLNFRTMSGLNAEQIQGRIFDAITPRLQDETYDSVMKLSRLAKSNPMASKRINERIAAIIADRGQEVIAAYLKGDVAELEKRNYYNLKTGIQDNYVRMYEVALTLAPPGHALNRQLTISKNYFEGLLWRLKIPTVEDRGEFVDKAFALQSTALKLEPYAAYIHNEMGNLYTLKGNADSALHHYKQASRLSPTWALPFANLIAYYNALGNIAKAKEAANMARVLQPDLQSIYINEAIAETRDKQWLRAEELLLHSIALNDRHYLPYDQLGLTYASTTQFALADSFYFEAAKRKEGFNFPTAKNNTGVLEFTPKDGLMKSSAPCRINALDDTVSNPIWLTLFGKEKMLFKEYEMAEYYFKKANAVAPDNFVINHYYGALLYAQGDIQGAEYFFNKASKGYKGPDVKDAFTGVDYATRPPGVEDYCYPKMLKELGYPTEKDAWYLGDIYERLGYYEKAAAQYKLVKSADDIKPYIAGHYLLASLYMSLDNYEAAENTWIEYRNGMQKFAPMLHELQTPFNLIVQYSLDGADLESFYDSMHLKFPDDGLWAAKASKYWYHKIKTNLSEYYFKDSIIENHYEDIPAWLWHSSLESPVRNRNFHFHQPAEYPYRKAMGIMEQYVKLAATDVQLAEAHGFLADIYAASSQYAKAQFHFKQVLQYAPANAQVRRNFAESYGDAKMYYNKFTQLDTLWQQGKLLMGDNLVYAAMAIHGKQYQRAHEALNKARKLGTADTDKIMELTGRMYYVQEDMRAMDYYKDSVRTSLSYPERLYAIATLYAGKSKKTEAMDWLNKALGNGFNYGYVLQNDPVWDAWSKTEDWKTMMAKYKFRTYVQAAKPTAP
jgi:tetratricopeptide (TPR) repeat protein